jgi:hypothetical protein
MDVQTVYFPFLTRQSHGRMIYAVERGSSPSILSFFSLSFTRRYISTLLDTHVCFRVPHVSIMCTSFEWPADDAEITSHT